MSTNVRTHTHTMYTHTTVFTPSVLLDTQSSFVPPGAPEEFPMTPRWVRGAPVLAKTTSSEGESESEVNDSTAEAVPCRVHFEVTDSQPPWPTRLCATTGLQGAYERNGRTRRKGQAGEETRAGMKESGWDDR